MHPIELDVSDRAAVADLPRHLPRTLDAVVNNAGIIVNGPIEAVAIDDLSRQLDVIVVSQVAVTQAVLPLIRRARGRIAFISSTSGLFATPGTGAYNASKFAVEAVGDAVRMELRPWRIRVSLIEPGPIETGMWKDALVEYDRMVASLSPEHQELYAPHFAGSRKLMATLREEHRRPPHGRARGGARSDRPPAEAPLPARRVEPRPEDLRAPRARGTDRRGVREGDDGEGVDAGSGERPWGRPPLPGGGCRGEQG